MDRHNLHAELTSITQQTLQDALTVALTTFGPSSGKPDAEKWQQVQTAAVGVNDAIDRLKDPLVPQDRAIADIQLRLPALNVLAKALDPKSIRQSAIIERLGTAQAKIEGVLGSERQR